MVAAPYLDVKEVWSSKLCRRNEQAQNLLVRQKQERELRQNLNKQFGTDCRPTLRWQRLNGTELYPTVRGRLRFILKRCLYGPRLVGNK